jgi:hypothetical protein
MLKITCRRKTQYKRRTNRKIEKPIEAVAGQYACWKKSGRRGKNQGLIKTLMQPLI